MDDDINNLKSSINSSNNTINQKNDTQFYQLLSLVRKLEQELNQTKNKVKKLEKQIEDTKQYEDRIKLLEKQSLTLDYLIDEKLAVSNLKNTLIVNKFDDKSFLSIGINIFSMCVYDNKNFIIGGENNFLMSYNINNNSYHFKFNPVSITNLSILKIIKLKNTESHYNLFATLERKMELERQKKINIVNIDKVYLFQSYVIIRQLNNQTILKNIKYSDINGRVSFISSAGNLLFFDFLPNYSYKCNDLGENLENNSSSSSGKYIRLYYQTINDEFLLNNDLTDKSSYDNHFNFHEYGESEPIGLDSRIVEKYELEQHSTNGSFIYNEESKVETIFKRESFQNSYTKESFETILLLSGNMFCHIFNNLSFNENTLKLNHHLIKETGLGFSNVINDKSVITSVCLWKKSTLYVCYGHSNTVHIYSLLPVMTKLRIIQTKYPIVNVKKLEYIDSFAIITTDQLILLINETQKSIKLNGAQDIDIIDYKSDTNQLKILFCRSKGGQVKYMISDK